MSKSVFIFGTFNPVTNAHVNMGILSKKAYPDRDIVYVPSNDIFLRMWKGCKNGSILNSKERVFLLNEVVSQYGFKVSNIEVNGCVDGRTYNTLSYFGWFSPVICLGADKLAELSSWYKAKDLLKSCSFLVVTRGGEAPVLPKELVTYSSRFSYVEGKYQDVSSTKVRSHYIDGNLDLVKNHIPFEVYDYLKVRKNIWKEG